MFRTIVSLLHRFGANAGTRLQHIAGRALPRFVDDRRANVAMIFAITLISITFATGMGIDYTNAARRRAKLDSAADAAALAAVTARMMQETTSAATTVAQNMFNAQASLVPGVSNIALTVNVTPGTGLSTVTRTALVSYTAQSQNAFGGIIGKTTLAIGGSSQATAATRPNINFYVLADSSPSMAIPATTAGINAMMTAAANSPKSGTNEGGCAFACHESNPSADNLGNPNGEDNYALAQSLGLTLRIDNLRSAIENLASTAATTAATNNAVYQMAFYTFDTNASPSGGKNGGCIYGTPLNTIAPLTSNMTTAATEPSNIAMLEVYNNTGLLTSNCNDSDGDTDINDALSGINSIMPTPGNGTNQKGDSPQEVLFFVTDRVNDCMNNGTRQISSVSTSLCTAITNRVGSNGFPIRIAVLYLNYLPLPNNSFYTQNVQPFQPNIGSTLQSCASPGLYAEVTTDGDISTALANVFANAVETAHLTQ
jgi:Flp pilus assembly protein TadG